MADETRKVTDAAKTAKAKTAKAKTAKAKTAKAANPNAGRFLVKDLAVSVDPAMRMLKVECKPVMFVDEVNVKCGQNTAKAFDLPLPTAQRDLDKLKQALMDALAKM